MRNRPLLTAFAPLAGALLAALTCTPLRADDRWHALAPTVFEHLVPAERNFPSPTVMSLAQDGDGFMWFGTQAGLGRWDGYQMRNFYFDADDPDSLPGDFIQTLHVDGQGRLWVGTSTGGLAWYDKLHERFVRVAGGSDGLSSPAVNAIASDGQGGRWVGTGAGLDYVNASGTVHRHPRVVNVPGGHRSNQIRALLLERDGTLWIGSDAGLARRDAASGRVDDIAGVSDAVLSLSANPQGGVVFGTHHSGVGLAPANAVAAGAHLLTRNDSKRQQAMVLSLTQTAPGQWWAATYGDGIIEFDASGRSRRIAHRAAMATSLASDRTAALWRDRSGLVWVANERGIATHHPANRSFHTILDGVGLPEISATAFMTDSLGRLWVALADQGIDLIAADATRRAGLRPDPLLPESALPSSMSLAMIEAEPGEAWIGTAVGLYHTSAQGSKVKRVHLPYHEPLPRIGSIVRRDGVLWLGTPNGLLRYDPLANTVKAYRQGLPENGGLSDNRITALLEAPDGQLWVGSHNGLNRFDIASGRAEPILPAPARSDGLSQGLIASLAFDPQGRLWVATSIGGISILEKYGDGGVPRFRRLSLGAGLPSNVAGALGLDTRGRMWASTSNGIAVINTTSLDAQSFGRPDGLVFQAYFSNAMGRTALGEMVFGTSGGYMVAQPEPAPAWAYQPPMAVSAVQLDKRSVAVAPLLVPGGPGLVTPSGTRSVEIEMAALDFTASTRNRYAYRLEGYDRDWVETDASHRIATYANVSPGTYRLHMRGSNRDGAWSPHEQTMVLHFLPAWYQTWWARSGAVLGTLLLGWGLYRWRVRQLHYAQILLQQQVYARTRHLARVHAIVKSINEQLDFDALLQAILLESSAIGHVSGACALVCTPGDSIMTVHASWQTGVVPPCSTMTPAEARVLLEDAAQVVMPDMYLSRNGALLAVRICIEQQVQGYLVFEQQTPFAEADLDMFKALKEPFISAFQKAHAIRAIQQARADAEASTRAKSDFLANISHEIRTPMNAILGFAGLGTHLDLPPKPRDYFQKIDRAGKNLLGIIDDVLDFSKIESGKLVLESVPFVLAEVIDQVADLFAWRAAEQGLELVAWADPDVPARLVGDPLRLSQVLINLLGNALKFTARGHLLLHVTLIEGSTTAASAATADGSVGTVRLQFAVIDTGVGISAEQQQRLFHAFSQADSSTTRLYGGTGLGLAISQQLVRAMGGVIEIDSTPGRGSNFHFGLTLPCMAAEQGGDPGLSGRRVLVIDGSEPVRAMLARQLGSVGMTVTMVASVAAALEAMAQWQTQPVDLVLLDWGMAQAAPDLLHRLGQPSAGGAGQAAHHPPVLLMVTELAREAALRTAGQAGVTLTVPKPVQPARLLACVAQALGLAAPPEPAATQAGSSTAAQRIAGTRVLVVDDNAINQQVAREVLLRANVQVELADSGRQALALLDIASFDAVLMDIQMPEMDGYQVTALIRSRHPAAQLPVIAMTAHAAPGFRENSLTMGMNDYVTKPIDPERLFAVLAGWIGTPVDSEAAVTVPSPELLPQRPVPVPAPGIDTGAALARLGGNGALLALLLDKFVEEFVSSPQRVLEAIGSGDYQQAALVVHKLKGAAGNLSMDALHRSAEVLETLLQQAHALAQPEHAWNDGAHPELAAFGAALEAVIDSVPAAKAAAHAAPSDN